MQLNKIAAKNYRNLTDISLTLGPGITLIKGNNEGGKTSLRKVFRDTLYGDPKTTSAAAKSQATWGNDSMYELSLEFTHDGQDFRLAKDFEAKTSVLHNMNNGKKFSDKKRIGEIISDALGIPTSNLLDKTVHFSAEELSGIKKADDIRLRLEEKLSGVEGVNVADLIKLIEGKISLLNKGRQRHTKDPGPIKITEDKLIGLREELKKVEDEVNNLTTNLINLDEANKGIEQQSKLLERKNSELAKCKLWEKACTEESNVKRTFLILTINLNNGLKQKSLLMKMKPYSLILETKREKLPMPWS